MTEWTWSRPDELPPYAFVCGHCGADVAPNKGWAANGPEQRQARVYICHRCTRPTFIAPFFNNVLMSSGYQSPGAPLGRGVPGISDAAVAEMFEEARRASSNAPTAAVLCCRKLLMHIAVAKGAKEGLTFRQYVDHLEATHWTPPDSKEWVDHIRGKGNEANHQVVVATRDDAAELIGFLEMLLRFIYEFPARVKKQGGTP